MKRNLLVGLFIVTLVSSGCSALNSERSNQEKTDPVTVTQAAEKFNQSSFTVSYSRYEGDIRTKDYQVDVTDGAIRHISWTGTQLGRTLDNFFPPQELDSGKEELECRSKCDYSSDAYRTKIFFISPEKIPESIETEFMGQKQVKNRTCNIYSMEGLSPRELGKFNDLLESKYDIYDNVDVTVCIDRGEGFISEIKYEDYGDLGGGKISYEMTGFSSKVKEATPDIPVAVNLDCESGQLSAVALEEFDSAEIEINSIKGPESIETVRSYEYSPETIWNPKNITKIEVGGNEPPKEVVPTLNDEKYENGSAICR